MKLLLDECVDRRFAFELEPLFVKTVPQMGWAGIKNAAPFNILKFVIEFVHLLF